MGVFGTAIHDVYRPLRQARARVTGFQNSKGLYNETAGTKGELRRRGWNVIVVWECELREPHQVVQRLISDLTAQQLRYYDLPPQLQMAAEAQATYRNTAVRGKFMHEALTI